MTNSDQPLKVIDYDQALENAAGDQAIFEAVCESALQEIPALFPELVASIEGGDMRESQRLAHTIKGAARVIAAVKTKEIAESIELAISKQDLANANQIMPVLAMAIDELKNELKKT